MIRTTVHRTSASINRYRALSAAAAAGLVGTLLAVTLGSATAMPGRGDPPPASAVQTNPRQGHVVAHGCITTPHTSNQAMLEELPVCYAYVP